MKLHKIYSRTPELDTEFSYCINNRLWNKEKIKIINNGTEFLAPKYYCARHMSQIEGQRLATKRYRAQNPLKFIKKNQEKYERQKQKRQNERKRRLKTNRIYLFKVMLTYNEYKLMWEHLYKEVRKRKDCRPIQTIEELAGKLPQEQRVTEETEFYNFMLEELEKRERNENEE